MIGTDVRNHDWLDQILSSATVIVIMEGVSMYLTHAELIELFTQITSKYSRVQVLADFYTSFAAKASKYKNPINDVGVTAVFGIDDPTAIQGYGLTYVKEHNMTPTCYINELQGMEKSIFRRLYAGGFAKKLYKIFEYQKNNC